MSRRVVQSVRCCNAGHAKQLPHCVQLKHDETTWQVRKPNTIRLGEAIQEFMQHQAKASPDGRQYQALLADGSLVDTSLTVAALALTPETQWRSGGLLRLKGCACLCVVRAGVPLGPASTRRVATKRHWAAPDLLLVHLQCLTLRQLQSQLLQLQSPMLQLQPPLWQLQSRLLQLQSPRL